MDEARAKTLMQPCDGAHWFGHRWTVNLYRGCCHGCIYCDSRSSCYRVHEFDAVRPKAGALPLLERELRGRRSRGVVGMGAMSDPYNPMEAQEKLTRGALELLARHGYGAGLTTKSDLAARDAPLLGEIARRQPAVVGVTVTAADDALARKIERNVCSSSARFAALEKLAAAGAFAGVLLMPVLPFIEDSEQNVLGVVRRAREHGARFVYAMMGVTLRGNQRQWFYDRLDEDFPGVKEQYRRAFGEDYLCLSPRSRELYAAFAQACGEAGLLWRMEDIIAASRAPYAVRQMSLFDEGERAGVTEEYREPRPEEAARFAAIAAEYLPDTPAQAVAAMPVRFCCVRDGEMIGVAFGNPRAPGHLCLQGIAIVHPHNAQGRGGRLLRALEERARSLGYRRISLGSADGYVERFYLKNGYAPVQLKIFAQGEPVVLPVHDYAAMDKPALTAQYGGVHSFFVFEKQL